MGSIHKLAEIAKTQPHAAYSVYEDIIKTQIHPCPNWKGGSQWHRERESSSPYQLPWWPWDNQPSSLMQPWILVVNRSDIPLSAFIIQQQQQLTPDTMLEPRDTAEKTAPFQHHHQTQGRTTLQSTMSHEAGQWERCIHMANCLTNWGTWLCPTQGSIRDVLCLRYNWLYSPPKQACLWQAFSVEHVLSFPTEDLPMVRHDELSDFTANVLREAHHDVCVESPCQPL